MAEAATLDGLGGWASVLGRLTAREDLPADLVSAAFTEILEGRASPVHIAGFAIGLRTKGESVRELGAILSTLLAHGVPVPLPADVQERAVDTCGTGGDRSHSVNVSTMAAFVVAGHGVPVCKHGNRAASSTSGSADVLESLGVVLELSPAAVGECVVEAGIGFCLAPRFHPALRHAAPIRRELAVATVFNFLGPLANPGGVRRQVIGVPDSAMAAKLAGVLAARGARAMVVRGGEGLDELSTTSETHIWDVRDGEVVEWDLDASTVGLPRASLADLRGGSPSDNATVLRDVLASKPGPVRDIVVLNAAAALVVAGVADTIEDGIARAGATIDDGRANAALERLIRLSQAKADPPTV